jgi:rRNA maturation endonuclease Nob1
MRRCDECGAIVPVHDQVCMSCGKDLDYPEEVFRLNR